MSIWQNIQQGLQSVSPQQKALLAAIVGASSPNPRMAPALGNYSQGLMQSAQEDLNRQQREKEAADLRAARAQEAMLRAEEARLTREANAQYRDDMLADRTEARKEADADRDSRNAELSSYNRDRLTAERERTAAAQEAAAALAEERKERAKMAKERERMAQAAEQRGDLEMAARLRGVTIPANPMGGLGGFDPAGMPGGSPSPTLDDLISAGMGRPPNG